jgi:hypothetical protein
MTATIDGHAISLSVHEIQKDGRGFAIRRLCTGKAEKAGPPRIGRYGLGLFGHPNQ